MTPPTDVIAALGAPLVQERRLLRLHTPLGADALFAEDLESWEGIGPTAGPALGDGEFDGDSWPDGAQRDSWAFDASLGPVRAGLRLVVHALSGDAHLELKTLIGQPALVELLCQDSATELRPWHGHIVAAALMGSDGGLARYRLVIEPWLSALAHAQDAWVFQDMSVPRILDELFGDYGGRGRLAPSWRWDLADAATYPRRSLCIQYHESDLDFAQRLMREEGLFCWWEHEGDAASDALGRHTLVIADHNPAIPPAAQPSVRFTASDHTLGEDSLMRWSASARVTSASVALRSRDHRGLGDRPVEALVGGSSAMPGLRVADVPGAYAYEDTAQGERLARRQAEALAATRSRALARGPWRRAQAGSRFTLRYHPRHDGSDAGRDTFVVLAAQHRARNDFSADEQARFVGLVRAIARDRGRDGTPGRGDADPLHEAALLVQPWAVPVRMAGAEPSHEPMSPSEREALGACGIFGGTGAIGDAGGAGIRGTDAPPSLFDPLAVAAPAQSEVRLNARPTVHGTQTALVVGDRGDIHTDRDGRIRVQFHWQRGSGSSHRLGHAAGDNAPASARSSTWVRVGQSLAGGNFGAVFTPRIGQEVLVQFIGGDIDRPVVTGVVYNGEGVPDAQGNGIAGGAASASGNAPAWFPGGKAADGHEGHRHPAVMLGYKSQELGASRSGTGGYSQLVFDDSAAGNRIELSTTLQASRLQLGALLHQQGNQRLAPRGHGLELATAAHGALRAGSGLLISAHTQQASTSSGMQLEAESPGQLLQTAQSLVHSLAESAQAHNAKLQAEPQVAGATGKDKERQLPVERGLHALQDSLKATDARGQPAVVDATGVSDTTTAEADPNTVAIDGGHGEVPAWGRPDLVLAAPAGIGLFTPAAAVMAAGAGVALSARQDINSLAQGHHTIAVKDGVVLYTHGRASDAAKPNAETGIALHAASGIVHTASNTGATRLMASGAMEVTSTKSSVLVASPKQIGLSAAGAALWLDGDRIIIKASGEVKFKARMKDLAGAAATAFHPVALSTAPEVHLQPQGPCSVRFAANGSDDLIAHAGFTGLPYIIRFKDGTILAAGIIAEDGRLPRVNTKQAEKVTLQIGDPDIATLSRMHEAPIGDAKTKDDLSEDIADVTSSTADTDYKEVCSRYDADLLMAAAHQYGDFLSEAVVAKLLDLKIDKA